ncbi:MAG: cell division protein SepF [Clostridia bacterium]|nr:cell division protein SepF [Clostridia bacterium]
MNVLKKLLGTNEPEVDEDYGGMYVTPDYLKEEMSDSEDEVSTIGVSARKEAESHAANTEKVALKLLQPKSHTEAIKIADKLKEGCIVLLDISSLTKDRAVRLIDFLAGVAYVLNGEMIQTNKNTIVVAPAGVDISDFTPEEQPVAEEEAAEDYEEGYEPVDTAEV